MKIHDCPASGLDRQHLLGEHHELHTMWSVITKRKKGYSKHPETLRWKGDLRGLRKRHEEQTTEFRNQDYAHHSPLRWSMWGLVLYSTQRIKEFCKVLILK